MNLPKNIIGIVVAIVVIIIIYVIYSYYSSASTDLVGLQSGQKSKVIKASTLQTSHGSANYAYSYWFYINDWSKNLNKSKTLLQRKIGSSSSSGSLGGPDSSTGPSGSTDGKWEWVKDKEGFEGNSSGGEYNPKITLAPYENNLHITIATYPTSSSSSSSSSSSQLGGMPGPQSLTCEQQNMKTCGSTGPDVCYEQTTPCPSMPIPSSSPPPTPHTCIIRNVPLQKWVNLIVSLNGRTLDVYIDGKLVRTCILPGVPRINQNSDLQITPNGGFSGWTSNVQYFAHPLNPQEAYNIYVDGPGSTSLMGLFEKYKLKISYLVDNQEKASIQI